ncbi:MAG: hypothetical protein U5K56_01585 [Halioglobus sp.]|nr:hypothetical protein [Halioglobus sp.]
MGDVLHSRPQVVNYGALNSFTETNPDLRLLVGTNSGYAYVQCRRRSGEIGPFSEGTG